MMRVIEESDTEYIKREERKPGMWEQQLSVPSPGKAVMVSTSGASPLPLSTLFTLFPLFPSFSRWSLCPDTKIAG